MGCVLSLASCDPGKDPPGNDDDGGIDSSGTPDDSGAPTDGGTDDGVDSGPTDDGIVDSGGEDSGGEDSGGGDGDDTGGSQLSLAGWTVEITASQLTAVADGMSAVDLDLLLRPPEGESLDDGTLLPLSSSRGTIAVLEPVVDHRTRATLVSGTWPGAAVLTVGDATMDGDHTIELVEGQAISVQLHLHGSLSEGAGTMRGHVEQAENNNIDVLWWTDHDHLHIIDGFGGFWGYDFDHGSTESVQQGWPHDRLEPVEWVATKEELPEFTFGAVEDAARDGAYGLRMSGTAAADSRWQSSELQLQTEPRFNFKPLIGDIGLSFSVRAQDLGDDVEVWITAPLSATRAGKRERVTDYRRVHWYLAGADYSEDSDEWRYMVPLDGAPGEWTDVSVNLSELVGEAFPGAETDTHAELIDIRVRARNGASFEVDFDSLAWTQSHVGKELRLLQEEFLEGLETEVQQLVGSEISWLPKGRHLNAFGSDVPFLPYAYDDDLEPAGATRWVHEAGGIVSLNHVFGVTGEVHDTAARLAAIDEVRVELLETDAYGADLLEVGYRRRGGELQDFLTLWDMLGMDGLVITGEGSSDMHEPQRWDKADNNFVTWAVAAVPDEIALMHALERGAAFFGDPTPFVETGVHASLTIPELEASMGQVVVGHETPVVAQFDASPLTPGWEVRMVVDGEVVRSWVVPEPEEGTSGPAPGTAGADDDHDGDEHDGDEHDDEDTGDEDTGDDDTGGSTGRGSPSVDFRARWPVDPRGGKLVRFEVWSNSGEDARGLLFTNPVYFVPEGTKVERLRRPIP